MSKTLQQLMSDLDFIYDESQKKYVIENGLFSMTVSKESDSKFVVDNKQTEYVFVVENLIKLEDLLVYMMFYATGDEPDDFEIPSCHIEE